MNNTSEYTPIHLERLVSRDILDLCFEVKEPISVSMGNEGNIKKIAVFSTKDGYRPFIPAESIKGVMRSLASRIYDNQCDNGKHNYNDIDGNIQNVDEELAKFGIFDKERLEELNMHNKIALYTALKCPICRLFGSQMLCGKLLFGDMFPSSDVKLFNYTGISINRKNRVVEEDRLYTIEYIMPSHMQLRIIADNVIDRQEKLLLATLLEIMTNKGINIGGMKSRGYGLLTIDKDRSRVTILEFVSSPSSKEDVIKNVRALLQQDNYRRLPIEEYIRSLIYSPIIGEKI